VCGGFAAHSDIPSWVYRVAFISLLVLGIGAIAYLALWVCMPLEVVEARRAELSESPQPTAG